MKKRIFVGNLAWKVTEDMLRSLFTSYGNVESVQIVIDRYTGKSKGFAFVEMQEADAAEKAVAGLNGQPLLERGLRVSMANEERRESRPAGGNYSGAGQRGDRGDRGDRGGERPYRPRSNPNPSSGY